MKKSKTPFQNRTEKPVKFNHESPTRANARRHRMKRMMRMSGVEPEAETPAPFVRLSGSKKPMVYISRDAYHGAQLLILLYSVVS